MGGCATRLGPQTIPGARFNYNDKIARSQNDQLLLNLVRLKYRDTLVFLDVGTVIAQYTLAGQVGAAPRINADGTGKTEQSAQKARRARWLKPYSSPIPVVRLPHRPGIR